ncbi:iron-containing alcohol dehydrogenase [Synechococcales cyanobacterium C]|uniref:Iron-containing alcohol dehydrogenase n=1 Tax=Petrachloros mirabilis ULC683 TaxID=2781853 RepID=A0A8K2A244_9CYAN|nr:iron-containing alcohol dehydrogenase family protein [Petrachloros mirabilis]NCJ08446.1 iron-containing alcohol dehydrogenase [Petrachloros mirabilis ULC683]
MSSFSSSVKDAFPVVGAELKVAPIQVLRGAQVLSRAGAAIARWGKRPLIIGGDRSLPLVRPWLEPVIAEQQLAVAEGSYQSDCSEPQLQSLRTAVHAHGADVILGVGGGKALDAAKLVAQQCGLPVITIPTSAATCAAWTALSNVYSDLGAFQYDVSLAQCPNLLILDYALIETAPPRTLIAGVGDALAKWYEASISSGASQETLTIAAVQQARVLRDILLQKALPALASPGSAIWREVVDATVLMAGLIGGLGGAQCRTVAAHAVHNGLTHLGSTRASLHGEKVAYGILVQLRLEELLQGSQLAASSRQQLLQFYRELGLPCTLADLGLGEVSLQALQQATVVACAPQSDLHHLPFTVTPEDLLAAMVSTLAPAHGIYPARNATLMGMESGSSVATSHHGSEDEG